MDMNSVRDSWREWGYQAEGGNEEKWDNCNKIINRKYLIKKKIIIIYHSG